MRNMVWTFLLISILMTGNAQSNTGLKLNLTFDRQELGIMDPWDFSLEVVNAGNVLEKLYAFNITGGRASNFGYIALEIKTNSDSIWNNTGCIVYMHNETLYPWIQLAPGESSKAMFYCPAPLKHLFIGEFKIRAVFTPFGVGHKTWLYSNEKTIKIIKYSGETLGAYEYLSRYQNPNFIFAPIYAAGWKRDSAEVAHAEYIVNTFPNASFRYFCELFLADFYFYQAMADVKKGKEAQIVIDGLRKSKKYGLSALNAKDKRIKDHADFILTGHLSYVLWRLYRQNAPKDLIQEFTYPPKK